MAESPQGLHDSRFSVRVHIPLPAVRPRQRSWGTSLPQSVILCVELMSHFQWPSVRLGYGALTGVTGPPARNGLALVLRFHVQPCWSDVNPDTCSETSPVPDPFRLQAAAGNQSAHPLVVFLAWGLIYATLLRAKHCDLAASLPPFLPPGTRGVLVPRAWRSGHGGLVQGKYDYQRQHQEKHLWLDSL